MNATPAAVPTAAGVLAEAAAQQATRCFEDMANLRTPMRLMGVVYRRRNREDAALRVRCIAALGWAPEVSPWPYCATTSELLGFLREAEA